MSDYEDVKVTDLVINNISQEKYDELKAAGQLEATQIYLTPTAGESGGLTEVTAGEGLKGNGTSDNPLAIDTVFLDTAISGNGMVIQAQQEAMNARTEAAQAWALAQMNEQALAYKQNTLTAEQQAAVDSGITADKVSTYDGYAAQIAGKQAAGDYVSASTEGTGGQLLSILLCSNEAEALELSGTHTGSLCFFPAVTE